MLDHQAVADDGAGIVASWPAATRVTGDNPVGPQNRVSQAMAARPVGPPFPRFRKSLRLREFRPRFLPTDLCQELSGDDRTKGH